MLHAFLALLEYVTVTVMYRSRAIGPRNNRRIRIPRDEGRDAKLRRDDCTADQPHKAVLEGLDARDLRELRVDLALVLVGVRLEVLARGCFTVPLAVTVRSTRDGCRSRS